MYNLEVAALAQAELLDAVRYYDAIDTELSIDLLKAYDEQLMGLDQLPERHPPYLEGTRIAHLRRFPYGLIFVIRGQTITILAFTHLKRRPGYWTERLQD